MQGQVSFSNDPFLNNLTHVKGWKRLRVTTALKTWNWNIKYLFLFEERHNTLLKTFRIIITERANIFGTGNSLPEPLSWLPEGENS